MFYAFCVTLVYYLYFNMYLIVRFSPALLQCCHFIYLLLLSSFVRLFIKDIPRKSATETARMACVDTTRGSFEYSNISFSYDITLQLFNCW